MGVNMENEELVKLFNLTLKRKKTILFFLIVVINGKPICHSSFWYSTIGPLATLQCWSLFLQDHLCGVILCDVYLLGFKYMHHVLTPIAKKTCPHTNYEKDLDNLGKMLLTTIGFNTTYWGNKTSGRGHLRP